MRNEASPNDARRWAVGGDWLDDSANPQRPQGDLMDALRGETCDRSSEGRIEPPRMQSIRARKV
jgi:hypothetical protein